jgi:hypothetical protein
MAEQLSTPRVVQQMQEKTYLKKFEHEVRFGIIMAEQLSTLKAV